MEDAMKLANASVRAKKIGANEEAFNNSIRSFEEGMIRRAASVAERSRLNMEDIYFTPGAPKTTIARWVRRALGNGWLLGVLLPLWLVKFLLRSIFLW